MRRIATLLLTALVAAGCAAQPGSPVASSSNPSPSVSATPEMPPGVPDRIVVTENAATVKVPAGFDGPHMEFADLDHGYAMFTRCGPNHEGCDALLFSTVDGGKSWKGRKHPQPYAKNQQLYVTDAKTVVLLAEPDAWYVSKDGAASWKKLPYQLDRMPADYPMAPDLGRYWVDCGLNYDGPCSMKDRKNAAWRGELPKEFAKSGAGVANGRDGQVWLYGMRDGQPITAMSQSGAGSFKALPVPKQESRQIYYARIMISPDGADVWLVADQEGVSEGGGNSAMRRASVLKGTGLPLLWQLRDGAWVPREITGIKEKPYWPYSVAPVGGGMLLIAGGEAELTGYLADSFVTVKGMPSLGWVSVRGNLLVGSSNVQGLTYLSARPHEWIAVRLSRS